MPIPDQQALDHLGLPALQGSNKTVRGDYDPRLLRSGTPCAFYDSSGTRNTALIGAISGTSINVTLTVGNRRVEFSGIPYSDSQTPQPYTWRFLNE